MPTKTKPKPKTKPTRKCVVPVTVTVAAPEHVLVLRVCDLDGKSRDGFQWPKSGPVYCADWKPKAECGNGLHGWLWGQGDHSCANWLTTGNAWLVVRVIAAHIVDLKDKVKFPSGEVVHFGDQASALAYLEQHGPADQVKGAPIIGAARTAGYLGSATAGYLGSATAGDLGSATAGDRGSATAGDLGSATAGDRGSATAGYLGSATAGTDGVLIVRHWDGTRWRIVVGYVGEDGIERGKPYHVEGGRLVPGEDAETKAAREEAAAIKAKKPADR